MSVENQVGDSKNSAVSQQMDCEKGESTDIDELHCESGNDDDGSKLSAEEKITGVEPVAARMELKSWFESLDGTERAAAMSFIDERFLLTLLAVASSSSMLEKETTDVSTLKGEYRFLRHVCVGNFAPSTVRALLRVRLKPRTLSYDLELGRFEI
jgi:hypothetical protein